MGVALRKELMKRNFDTQDCRNVEDLVKDVFGLEGPRGVIVFVGQKAE